MTYRSESRDRPFVVAITGGIASGKTTVSNCFKKLGVPVIDTDLIARELVTPGQPALQQIKRQFGEQYFQNDGKLNREKLRKTIFSNPARKKQLENILHPAIEIVAQSRIRNLNSPYCILVIPLLIESKSYDWVDRILVVDLPEKLQVERLKDRDFLSSKEATAVMSSQSSRKERLAKANDIIDNSGVLQNILPVVQSLHDKYLEYSKERKTQVKTSI